jgi:alkanesulfonate monooxygenase SsuD/methylene tetrahydromethanopterin reductase-like flavin-dependent oxidoreductase (luciferase family)
MRFGVYSANFGALGDPRTLIDLALISEEAGWDGFFLYDHIVLLEGRAVRTVDPWIVLAVVAERTGLLFGPLITPVGRRQPWELAHQTIALNRLSNGRLILGVGLGERADHDAFGDVGSRAARGERLDEGLEILQRFWSGAPVSHMGSWRVTDARISPGPLSRIPIWVAGRYGGRSPRPVRRAARFDGFFPIYSSWDVDRLLQPAEFAEMVAAVRQARGGLADFELVTAGVSGAGDAGRDLVAAFAEAGATWWLEVIEPRRARLDALRERIAAGPPRIMQPPMSKPS